MKRPLLISALLAWVLPSHVLTLTIYPKEKRGTPKIVEIQRNQLLHLLGKESFNDLRQIENQATDSVKDEANNWPIEQQYQQYYSDDYYKHYLPGNEITVDLNGSPLGLPMLGLRGENPYQLVLTGEPAQNSHVAQNYIPLPPPVMPYGLIFQRSPMRHYQDDEDANEYANRMRQHQQLAVQSLKLGYYTQTSGQDQQELNGVIYNSPIAAVYMNNIQRPNDQTGAGVKVTYGAQPTRPVYHYQPVPKGTFSGEPISEGRIKSDIVPVNHKDVNPQPHPAPEAIVQVAPLHMSQSSSSTSHSEGDEETRENIKYDFGYRVVDEGIGLEFGKTEMKKDGLTQGSYHVLLPDGRLQVVKYWSDHTGYHTDISYSVPGKN